jgi:hypothetical protein
MNTRKKPKPAWNNVKGMLAVFKDQNTSVAKTKKVISDDKRAIGQPRGLAERKVFYCERAAVANSEARLASNQITLFLALGGGWRP